MSAAAPIRPSSSASLTSTYVVHCRSGSDAITRAASSDTATPKASSPPPGFSRPES